MFAPNPLRVSEEHQRTKGILRGIWGGPSALVYMSRPLTRRRGTEPQGPDFAFINKEGWNRGCFFLAQFPVDKHEP